MPLATKVKFCRVCDYHSVSVARGFVVGFFVRTRRVGRWTIVASKHHRSQTDIVCHLVSARSAAQRNILILLPVLIGTTGRRADAIRYYDPLPATAARF